MNAPLETLRSFSGLTTEQQCQRVGIDAEPLLDAGIVNAVRLLLEYDPDGEPLHEITSHLAAAFAKGAVVGARMAQAGLAVPEAVL